MNVKQFWIEDDEYIKPHRFVFESDHLAAIEALRQEKDREIEGLKVFKEELVYHAFHDRWDNVKELLKGEIPQ